MLNKIFEFDDFDSYLEKYIICDYFWSKFIGCNYLNNFSLGLCMLMVQGPLELLY